MSCLCVGQMLGWGDGMVCPVHPPDQREPRSCPRCGQVCKHDGWGHVHTDGLGIGSCRTTTSLRSVDSDGRRRETTNEGDRR